MFGCAWTGRRYQVRQDRGGPAGSEPLGRRGREELIVGRLHSGDVDLAWEVCANWMHWGKGYLFYFLLFVLLPLPFICRPSWAAAPRAVTACGLSEKGMTVAAVAFLFAYANVVGRERGMSAAPLLLAHLPDRRGLSGLRARGKPGLCPLRAPLPPSPYRVPRSACRRAPPTAASI